VGGLSGTIQGVEIEGASETDDLREEFRDGFVDRDVETLRIKRAANRLRCDKLIGFSCGSLLVVVSVSTIGTLLEALRSRWGLFNDFLRGEVCVDRGLRLFLKYDIPRLDRHG